MKIQIKSTLDKIATDVFKATNLQVAQQITLSHLSESHIKETDKNRMIEEINKVKTLTKLQYYIANALLKYEGLSLAKKPSETTEQINFL